MKLLIAIPAYSDVPVPFIESLDKLRDNLRDNDIEHTVEYKTGTLVYAARDALTVKARQEDYTHVLWLDSDMIFTEQVVDDLLFCGKPFVSGVYHGRRPPHVSCVFKSLHPIERYVYGGYPTDAFKIGGCGLGCCLMETSVLKAVWDKYSTCFLPTAELGEDLAFCARVASCGIEMWAEPSIRLGHIGHLPIYPEDEIGWRERVDGIERFL